MTYSEIAKIAWSTNYMFTDLQLKLQHAVDEELDARGQPHTDGQFYDWPAEVSESFFSLCMEVLFALDEHVEETAGQGVSSIAEMILALHPRQDEPAETVEGSPR